MANQRWTADKNIQFIKEYQRNECLWDPKHSQYRNRGAREAAYKKIMSTLKMGTVKDVVGKIRTLRNTYNNETLKAKKRNSTGMAANEFYISKISWLSHLAFLKNIDSCTRENTENVVPNVTRETSVSESNSQEFTVPHTLARNKRKINDPLPKAVGALELEKVTTRHFSNANNDEFDLFGRTVAEQLRQLPLEIALETEEMILCTIRKQRIRVAKFKQIPFQRDSLSSITNVGSSKTDTIDVTEEQQFSQRPSSSESIASTSGITAIETENEYSLVYDNN